MSWDIFVQDFPWGAATVDDVPDDWDPSPLMPRQALIDGITAVVPNADFSDPAWGTIEGPDYSIEVNSGDEDPVMAFTLHVTGGDLAAGIVADILEHFDLRAADTGRDDGGFFDREGSLESLQAWRRYRDQFAASTPTPSGDSSRPSQGTTPTGWFSKLRRPN